MCAGMALGGLLRHLPRETRRHRLQEREVFDVQKYILSLIVQKSRDEDRLP
jgi:hypothetical protein